MGGFKSGAGLRKEIVDYFEKENGKDRVRFKNLTKKELIVKDLKPWIEQHLKPDGEMYFFEEGFKTFTTYFSGYNQNRENMYTDELNDFVFCPASIYFHAQIIGL